MRKQYETFEEKIKRSFRQERKRPLFLLSLIIVLLFVYSIFIRDYIKMRVSTHNVNVYIEKVELGIEDYIENIKDDEIYSSGIFFQKYLSLKNTLSMQVDVIVLEDNEVAFTSGPLLQSEREKIFFDSLVENYQAQTTDLYFTSYRKDQDTYPAIYTRKGNYSFLFLLSNDCFNSLLSEQPLPHLIITDDKNYVMSYSGLHVQDKLGKFYPEHKISQNYRNIQMLLKYGNYSISFLFPKSNQILDLTMMLFLLATSVLLIILSINKMAKKVGDDIQLSINNLIAGAQSIKSGQYGKTLEIETGDEMQILVETFNDMSLALEDTLQRNEELLELSKEAQIKQLEAQFNPHFLFNSLEALRYTILSDPHKASDSLVVLSELLRYSLSSKSGSKVFLHEDLSHIHNYLSIHKLRLKDDFSYQIQCDKSLYDERVPKLLIQPLIENSLNHAYKANGYLNLKVKIQDYVTKIAYIIEDDGPGIEQDVLKKMKTISSKQFDLESGFGLKSVIYRLHLLYGEQSHFRVYSSEKGTRVLITIPKERKQE